MNRPDWQRWGIIIGITGYGLFRIALIPHFPEKTFSFHHDSAYLATVAQNVVSGKGLVNDALWLVFLNPERLPMPFHNSNPLYPTLVAFFSWMSGINIVSGGYILSALSSCLLAFSLFLLVEAYCKSRVAALLIALAGTLFPLTLLDSFCYLTDALFAALFFSTWAALVRNSSGRTALLAGLLFGATWLTRSQAMLMIPSVIVFVLLKGRPVPGVKEGFKRLCLFGFAAFMVISPWLIHQYTVWGDPFRSDSSYYLLEEIQAKKFGNSVERFWHSPQTPPSLFSLVQENPGDVLLHSAKGLFGVVRKVVSKWSLGSIPAGLLFALITFLFLRSFIKDKRYVSFGAETIALFVYCAMILFVFSLRGNSFEIRYVNTITVFFSIVVAAGSLDVLKTVWAPGTSKPKQYLVMGLLGILWLGIIPQKNYQVYRMINMPDPQNQYYRYLARQIDQRFSKGRPVVVGTKPYHFAFATGGKALSIPESDDLFLLGYMNKYGADFIFLTEEELRFWRPGWLSDGTPTANFPKDLKMVERLENAFLFRKREGL